jgi:hypothetical protein
MHFTDLANDLLAIADKRKQVFAEEISVLGEDTWHVMLKLYASGDSRHAVHESSLGEVMQFPTNLDRILSVLARQGLVTGNITETGVDRTLTLTDKALSDIQTVLGVAGTISGPEADYAVSGVSA